MGLCSAVTDPEAGHHFVEDQQGAVFFGEFAQPFQEAWLRRDEARIADDGLQDDAGDRSGVFGEQLLHRLKVVVRGRQRVGGGAAGDAGGVRQPEGCHTGPRLHQEHVGMAVITAFELDHLVAPCERTHQAQHRHAGFGSAVDETHHLHTGNGINHHFGQGVLQAAGCSEAGAFLDRFLKSAGHLRVGMAADGRSPAADVIDVFVSIDVPGVGPLDPIEHDRLTTNRLECPHWRAHSTGHQGLGGTEDGLRAAGVQRGTCHGDRRQRAVANRATS